MFNRKSRHFKFKPTTIAMLVIVVAFAGHALIVARFYQGQGAYDSLTDEVESVELTRDRFKNIAELRAELATTEAQLEEVRSLIPAKQSNTSAIQSLLEIANASNLDVLEIRSQVGDNEAAGEHTYGSMTIRIRVEGSLKELIAYLENIENGSIEAARVDDLSINELSRGIEADFKNPDHLNTGLYEQITLVADLRVSIFSRT